MQADQPIRDSGLRSIAAEDFSAAAVVGGWRGIVEASAPTLLFMVIAALLPQYWTWGLVGAGAIVVVAMVARLLARQSLSQVWGGAFILAISAIWAWKSGRAENFYAPGFIINGVWLAACLISMAVRWPLIGLLMTAWNWAAGTASTGDTADTAPETSGTNTAARREPQPFRAYATWVHEPEQRGLKRRYYVATAILTALFALRLGVELPLYFAGTSAATALGAARLLLGLPLFVLALWLIWLLIRPTRR